jgi:hypothetical protein
MLRYNCYFKTDFNDIGCENMKELSIQYRAFILTAMNTRFLYKRCILSRRTPLTRWTYVYTTLLPSWIIKVQATKQQNWQCSFQSNSTFCKQNNGVTSIEHCSTSNSAIRWTRKDTRNGRKFAQTFHWKTHQRHIHILRQSNNNKTENRNEFNNIRHAIQEPG